MRFLELKKNWSMKGSFAPLYQPRWSTTWYLKKSRPPFYAFSFGLGHEIPPKKIPRGSNRLFGKRGISWHITTATRMYEGQLQMLSFVHIFQSCNQDSNTVFDDVLKQLKEQCPKSIASTLDGTMLDATRAHLHYWQFSIWPKTTISAKG